MKEEKKALEVVAETEILGKTIKMYGDIDNPLFMAKDVVEWIDYSKNARGKYKITNMLKKVDDEEKGLKNFNTLGGVQETWFLTEDGLYECCMRSTKLIAKSMRKQIKAYLKSIRKTGAAIQPGREPGREMKMIDNYFPSVSEETKKKMVDDLLEQNKELKAKVNELTEFYGDLMNTKEYMSINTMAKELRIGEYKLFNYLRDKKVFFYDYNDRNVPYERFEKKENLL